MALPDKILWGAADAIATVFTTEMDSDTDGTRNLSSALSNDADDTEERTEIVFELALGSFTAAATGRIDVYILYEVDGTNYEDGSGTRTPTKPPDYSFPLEATAQTYRIVSPAIQLLPFNFKILEINNAGATLAASGNSLKIRRLFREVVD